MKFHGEIGFSIPKETAPGVYMETEIVKRMYRGDTVKKSRRLSGTENVNDNIMLSENISIVSDPFARENFIHMKYVNIMGVNWKIENVEIQYPRLVLTLGGVWNG